MTDGTGIPGVKLLDDFSGQVFYDKDAPEIVIMIAGIDAGQDAGADAGAEEEEASDCDCATVGGSNGTGLYHVIDLLLDLD